MKKKRVIFVGLFVIVIVILMIIISSVKLRRLIYYNFADINDYKIFESRPLHNDSVKYTFNKTDKERYPKKFKNIPFEKFLEDNNTVAFLIIKNDTLRYEKYFHEYNEESIVPSMSMGKSITSILIGCAIDDGLIKSVDEQITIYIPELKKNGFDKIVTYVPSGSIILQI